MSTPSWPTGSSSEARHPQRPNHHPPHRHPDRQPDRLLGSKSLKFSASDPNDPSKPLKLEFDRHRRSFVLPPTHYFPGGQVNVYQVYHRWNY